MGSATRLGLAIVQIATVRTVKVDAVCGAGYGKRSSKAFTAVAQSALDPDDATHT